MDGNEHEQRGVSRGEQEHKRREGTWPRRWGEQDEGRGRKLAGWVGTVLACAGAQRKAPPFDKGVQGARKGGCCSLGGPARGVTCQPAGERGLQGLADPAAVGNLMVGLQQQRTADSASLHRQRTAGDRFTCRALQTK